MKAFLNWSGGKDSAYCLYQSRQNRCAPEALVTSLNKEGRVTMHGVPAAMVERQAASIQLPLHFIHPNEESGERERRAEERSAMALYERAIHRSNLEMKAMGFSHVHSGDLFLEDLRNYRRELYHRDGLHAQFPIWRTDSWVLLKNFLALGFKAVVVAVQSDKLGKEFCGRMIDDDFIRDLPHDVDPCGENGEYHSFVFDGPIFTKPVQFSIGTIVEHYYPAPKTSDCFTVPRPEMGFYFCELLPA